MSVISRTLKMLRSYGDGGIPSVHLLPANLFPIRKTIPILFENISIEWLGLS